MHYTVGPASRAGLLMFVFAPRGFERGANTLSGYEAYRQPRSRFLLQPVSASAQSRGRRHRRGKSRSARGTYGAAVTFLIDGYNLMFALGLASRQMSPKKFE